eukprot:9050588-Pyramimonas_sp.AAC.1
MGETARCFAAILEQVPQGRQGHGAGHAAWDRGCIQACSTIGRCVCRLDRDHEHADRPDHQRHPR